jgi:amino acid transporter
VGPIALLALGVNGIVGVGIFFAPASVAQHASGTAGILVFAVMGVALLPVALAFAVLGRRFDEDGGPVVFARAAFGTLASFLVGWVAYVSAFLSAAAVVFGLTRAVASDLGFADPASLRLGAVALTTALALVVASGISISARVWTALTVLKLVPLLALLAAFVAFSGSRPPLPPVVAEPSWLRAGLIAMFTLQGFEIVPVIAGQVRTPARAIPMATVASLLLAIALYLGLMGACVLGLPALAASRAPLADAAARLVAVGTTISALGISFGQMVATPRYLSALSSGARSLFGVERLSPRGVPLKALFVTWLLVSLLVQRGDLTELFALSAIGVLLQFGVTAAALATLAWRRERGLTPAHVGLAAPTLALALVLVAFGATAREAVVALLAVGAGFLLSLAARPRATPAPSGGGEGRSGSTAG